MQNLIDSYNANMSEVQLSNIEDIQSSVSVKANFQVSVSTESLLGNVPSSFLSETPTLSQPKTGGKSTSTINSLSEDAIMTMLGFENSKSEMKSAQSSLKTNAQFRKQENDKLINKLQEQAKKIESNAKLNPIKKFFKIFGAVLGIAAGIAATVASGGALAVAGLVISSLLGLESIMSTASDGKLSLAAACCKAFGDDAGPKVAMSIQIILTAASIFCSFASLRAAKNVAEKAVDIATKLENTAKTVSCGISSVSAATNLASSCVDIVSSINQYGIAKLKASQKIIQAYMNDLMAEEERQAKRLGEILQNSRDNAEKVKEIIDELNEVTATAVAA